MRLRNESMREFFTPVGSVPRPAEAADGLMDACYAGDVGVNHESEKPRGGDRESVLGEADALRLSPPAARLFDQRRAAFLRTTRPGKAFPDRLALTGGMDRMLAGRRHAPAAGSRHRAEVDPRLLAALHRADHAARGHRPISRFLGDAGAALRARRWSAPAITFLVYLALRAGRANEPRRQGDRRRPALPAGLDRCSPSFNYYIFYVYAPLDAAKMPSRIDAMSMERRCEMAARSIARRRRSPGISCSPPGPPSTSR